VGVIASVSRPFCGDCSRARLTAEGKLFTCLFSNLGHDLKEPLRAGAEDDALLRRIADVWGARRDRYSEERGERLRLGLPLPPEPKVEMFRVGG
jgi:cyclic pyranopterin phosphate synthase